MYRWDVLHPPGLGRAGGEEHGGYIYPVCRWDVLQPPGPEERKMVVIYIYPVCRWDVLHPPGPEERNMVVADKDILVYPQECASSTCSG